MLCRVRRSDGLQRRSVEATQIQKSLICKASGTRVRHPFAQFRIPDAHLVPRRHSPHEAGMSANRRKLLARLKQSRPWHPPGLLVPGFADGRRPSGRTTCLP